MKQISIQITDATAQQMAQLARHWGLPPARHNTPVIERAIATIFMLEIGYDLYQKRLEALQAGQFPLTLVPCEESSDDQPADHRDE